MTRMTWYVHVSELRDFPGWEFLVLKYNIPGHIGIVSPLPLIIMEQHIARD